MKRTWVVLAALMLGLVPAPAPAQDIYYFHDSPAVSGPRWGGLWYQFQLCRDCWHVRHEPMDCSAPTGDCSSFTLPDDWYGRGYIDAHLAVPVTGTVPGGAWVMNLWLKADSPAPVQKTVQADLVVEDGDCLCIERSLIAVRTDTTLWLGPTCAQFTLPFNDRMTYPPVTLTHERLWIRFIMTPGTVICWDGRDCPSQLVAPGDAFCATTGTASSTWGCIKSLYR